MSCRTTVLGSVGTSVAKVFADAENERIFEDKSVPLTDPQVLSTFHQLRADFYDYDAGIAPSKEKYDIQKEILLDKINSSTLSDNRKKSLKTRLDKIDDDKRDSRNLYAIKELHYELLNKTKGLLSYLDYMSTVTGEKYSTVKEDYQQISSEVLKDRINNKPENFQIIQNRLRSQQTFHDTTTIKTISRLYDKYHLDDYGLPKEGYGPPRRIELQEVVNGVKIKNVEDKQAVIKAGYDPSDGRLEYVLSGREDRAPQAYYGVTEKEYEQLISAATYDQQKQILDLLRRGGAGHQYSSLMEAEIASLARKCETCGQFKKAGHVCPPTKQDENQAKYVRSPGRPRGARGRIARFEHGPHTMENMATSVNVETNEITSSASTPEEKYRSVGPYYNNTRIHLTIIDKTVKIGDGEKTQTQQLCLPEISTLRRIVKNEPIQFEMSYAVHAESDEHTGFSKPVIVYDADGKPVSDNALYVDEYKSTGVLQGRVFLNNSGDNWNVASKLECPCFDYKKSVEKGDNPPSCPHTKYVHATLVEQIVPTKQKVLSEEEKEERRVKKVKAALQKALNQTYGANKEVLDPVVEAQSWKQQADQSIQYSDDFDAYQRIAEQAVTRKQNGEPYLQYMTENATDGLLSPESKTGFGVELEFVVGGAANQKRRKIEAMAKELHEKGYTSSPHMREYGYMKDTGYSQKIKGGWSFESDSTVDAELVSPIMYDTPETWESLQEVCDIIRKHGGTAKTTKAGSHVHIGFPRSKWADAIETVKMVNQYEDVMYRVSTNPEAEQHRGMRYCAPSLDGKIYDEDGVIPKLDRFELEQYTSHSFNLNLESVDGTTKGHMEFRHWDATLDPAVIQTQVKISAAIAAASRRAAKTSKKREDHSFREPVGTHYKLVSAQKADTGQRTVEHEETETLSFRRFADTIFKRNEDKEQLAALFAVTPWAKKTQNPRRVPSW